VAQVVQIPLGELSDVTAGPSGSFLENLRDGPDGIPVISPPDITEDHMVEIRRVRRIPPEDARKLTRFAVQEGDILVVRQGALGRLALVSAEQTAWLYNSSCLRIRPRTELVLPEYLTSYLSYPPVREQLLGQAMAGTVPYLNSAILKELLVIVPSIDHQQVVIDTIADIDAQIDIQRAIASRLDALRPAIFGDMIHRTEAA
jgi:type I restriction enzyme S subunit